MPDNTAPYASDRKIRFRLDARARIITMLALLAIAGAILFLYRDSGGSYLPAWFSALIGALMLLAFLSVPRFMLITPHSIEIHCIMELRVIPIRDIKTIRPMDRKETRWSFPLWGIYGILGYYGYYFNPRTRRVFRMYAAQRKNLVLIEDIYEEQYVVSCDGECSDFIAQVEAYRQGPV